MPLFVKLPFILNPVVTVIVEALFMTRLLKVVVSEPSITSLAPVNVIVDVCPFNVPLIKIDPAIV